ncbi:MAG: hypothetical protein A2Y10_03715 [Planctomycetes bacterium GWF2_41_51]|nr:MAG: hypothetical protein A2Y10_03715 [Planctomycetes bacterium GWF2_41_51]HBG28851.1 hypothetical protein [Phycisphaerales bacterium]
MSPNARDYTDTTLKKLYGLSGNTCAFPGCEKKLIARDGETIISKICHIEAANKNGARYNPNMTDNERRHFNNLILFCDECHCIIDNKTNEAQYPVELLKEWKRNHESSLYSKFNSNPSLLNIAINAIANIDFEEVSDKDVENIKVFGIEQKITYNSIKRNKALIDEYMVFYDKVNSLYDEMEKQGSFKKEKLLRNIKKIYLKIKGNYVGDSSKPIEIIRENADNIIEDIENTLLKLVNNNGGRYYEDITFGISVIMVDAFMRCKILEEPKKQ